MHETLSQSCSMDEDESKRSIVNETLMQNYSADKYELSFLKEDKSECTITEKKRRKE